MFEPIKRPVGIVVFEERNQRGRHRHRLPGTDVNVLNSLLRHSRQIALHASQHRALLQRAVFFHRVRRSQNRLHFLVGAQILMFAVDFAVTSPPGKA